MHCKYCGFKLKENIKYCTNCGTHNSNDNKNKQKTFYGRYIIIGLVLVNLLVIIYLVMYTKSINKEGDLNSLKIYNKENNENTSYYYINEEPIYEYAKNNNTYINEGPTYEYKKNNDTYKDEANLNIKDSNDLIQGKAWEGIYEAGEYDRSVKITFLEDETITFEFGPTEKTKHVPYGKYLMKVNSYDEISGELKLEGYEWIEKPEIDWDFAKFNGFINENEFKGEVYNKSKNHYLGTFNLIRVN